MIKLLILSVDGVMNDGTKQYNRFGRVVSKKFCDKDWTTIKRFISVGVPVVFISSDSYDKFIFKRRNLKLFVTSGKDFHQDRVNYLDDILSEYDCTPEEVAYLGHDLQDYGIMNEVGYPYCVYDSPKLIHDVSAVLPCKGGDNALMYLFEELENENLIPSFPYDVIIEKIYKLN